MKLKNNQFYIMRHGETIYQTIKKDFVYPGEGSVFAPGLTDTGKMVVCKTALEIKKLSIDIIYSSDFRRTRETAEIVSREIGLKDDSLILTPKLRDINLGRYHDGPKKDFHQDLPNFLTDFNQRPENGETLAEAEERLVSFVKELDIIHKDKNILIISHGEPLWLLEGAINKRKKSDMVNKDKTKRNYIQPAELKKLNY